MYLSRLVIEAELEDVVMEDDGNRNNYDDDTDDEKDNDVCAVKERCGLLPWCTFLGWIDSFVFSFPFSNLRATDFIVLVCVIEYATHAFPYLCVFVTYHSFFFFCYYDYYF